MPRPAALAVPALTLALALAPARAQDELAPAPAGPEAPAAEREALVARAREFALEDERWNRLRFDLVKLQERVALAEDAAMAFREGKTPEDLARPEVRREGERLLADVQSARTALEEQTTGAPRARFVALRDRLAQAYGALVRDLDAALARFDGDVTLRLVRGRLLADKGRFDEARRDAEAAIRARPDDPDALVLLGMGLVVENRFDEAAALFDRAVEKGPSDERRAYQAIGRYCTNRFAEARAARDAIARLEGLPVTLQMRCAWWLTDGELGRVDALWAREASARAAEAARGDLPRVVFETTRGPVEVELFEDHAPNAVAGVVELVAAGFYDGLAWDRVVPNLLAATGDPATRAAGVAPVASPAPTGAAPPGGEVAPVASPARPGAHDPGYAFADDPGVLDPATARGHFRGTVSLARTAAPDSATGALLFVVMPAASLDGRHEPIGRVVTGQAVVDRLRDGDRVTRARVTRRRDHPYAARRAPPPAAPAHDGR